MKHTKTLSGNSLNKDLKKVGCGECQTSCQSACKTSCTEPIRSVRENNIISDTRGCKALYFNYFLHNVTDTRLYVLKTTRFLH